MNVQEMVSMFCCIRLNRDIETKQVEFADGKWHILGCCGGGCYVMTEIDYCPYCGQKLEAVQ